MKKFKRIAAGAFALIAAIGMASCGSSANSNSETGTADSSSMPEKKLEEEQQEVVENTVAEMETRELENNTIDWFCHWDINPTASDDKDIGVDLALFKSKYNGVIKWSQTTWETKFDDLAARIMAKDSPDFIPADDMDYFPRGAIKNMIQPIDDYIDFDSDLWKDVKAANDKFKFKDGHYVAVSRVDPNCIWIYNKNVIEESGMEDPAELYAKGEWNWKTFADMCIEFTDADNDKYALDAWYYENALTESSGLPLIDMVDGKIVNNIKAPELEKAQNMMYELQKNNVVYPKHEHDWKIRGDGAWGDGVASGLTLFYPIGLWAIEDAPSATKNFGDISAGEVMFVPVPCAEDSDAMYVPSRVHGFCICEGAKNPEGVAAWLDCTRYAELDENAHQITIEQFKKDYGWTDEMIEMRDNLYKAAAEHPVFEFAQGISPDIAKITDSVIKNAMNPAETKTWAQTISENENAINFLLDEAQSKMD